MCGSILGTERSFFPARGNLIPGRLCSTPLPLPRQSAGLDFGCVANRRHRWVSSWIGRAQNILGRCRRRSHHHQTAQQQKSHRGLPSRWSSWSPLSIYDGPMLLAYRSPIHCGTAFACGMAYCSRKCQLLGLRAFFGRGLTVAKARISPGGRGRLSTLLCPIVHYGRDAAERTSRKRSRSL